MSILNIFVNISDWIMVLDTDLLRNIIFLITNTIFKNLAITLVIL